MGIRDSAPRGTNIDAENNAGLLLPDCHSFLHSNNGFEEVGRWNLGGPGGDGLFH
jgi:hypothetical protein